MENSYTSSQIRNAAVALIKEDDGWHIDLHPVQEE